MKKSTVLSNLLSCLLLTSLLFACNVEEKQTGEIPGDTTPTTTYTDSVDLVEMPNEAMDPHVGFTYNYVEDDDTVDTLASTNATDKKTNGKPHSTPPKLKIKSTPGIYTVSQTDRPPLFSANCLTDKDPQRCSNSALAQWAKNSVKYPEADLTDGSDGLEYVTFVINKLGKVTSISHTENKKEACAGCSQAVLDAVKKMPDWQPAMLNGKPVSVMVTLPIRFRVVN